MTPIGEIRYVSSIFECFNKNHVDGGMGRILQGIEFAAFGSTIRGLLTLPVYESTRKLKVFNDKSLLDRESTAWLYHFWQSMGPAMISTLLISVLMYEFDTVKKQYQLNGTFGQKK